MPAATAIVPYEKLVLPADLDGRAGRCRAPGEKISKRRPGPGGAPQLMLLVAHRLDRKNFLAGR